MFAELTIKGGSRSYDKRCKVLMMKKAVGQEHGKSRAGAEQEQGRSGGRAGAGQEREQGRSRNRGGGVGQE